MKQIENNHHGKIDTFLIQKKLKLIWSKYKI